MLSKEKNKEIIMPASEVAKLQKAFENVQNAKTFVERLKEAILDAKLEKTKEHVEALHVEEEIKKKREKHKEKLNEKKYEERSHEIFKP